MFIHKKCSNRVFLDFSKNISLIMPINITKDGIFPMQGSLRLKNNDVKAEYRCIICDEIVDLDDMVAGCMECGKIYPLKELFRLGRSSGIYCGDCQERYFPGESKTSLYILAKKPIFGG